MVAIAWSAAKRRTRQEGHTGERGHRTGSGWRYGSGSLTLYAGQPFRQVLRDLRLTSNQVWGLTKTDREWSAALRRP